MVQENHRLTVSRDSHDDDESDQASVSIRNINFNTLI